MDVTRSSQYIIRNAQDPPKNTARTKYEAIAEQYRIIKRWKPWSDVYITSLSCPLDKAVPLRPHAYAPARLCFVGAERVGSRTWPLRAGRGILIGAATLTSIYINHRFRARLKFRDYGVFPTMFGLTLAPATMTAICHTEFVLNKLVLLEMPCPLCMESKSALLQTCSGLFLPLILAPAANFSIAAGSGVYNVPYITNVRKIFSTILSVYQPLIPQIAMIFTFHALLAGCITYLEIKSYLRILDLQYLMEEEKKQIFK